MGKTEPAEKRPDLIKPRPTRKPEPQSRGEQSIGPGPAKCP